MRSLKKDLVRKTREKQILSYKNKKKILKIQ